MAESSNVEKNLEGLSLEEDMDEGLTFEIEEEAHQAKDIRLCLVGRFIIEKLIKGVNSITEAEQGFFVFQFYHKMVPSSSTITFWLWGGFNQEMFQTKFRCTKCLSRCWLTVCVTPSFQ